MYRRRKVKKKKKDSKDLYLELVVREYEIERDKKTSYENRTGFILALLGVLILFMLEKMEFKNQVQVVLNYGFKYNDICFYKEVVKIFFGIGCFIFLILAFFASIEIIGIKLHFNIDTKIINQKNLEVDDFKTKSFLISRYRKIINDHRTLNEKRSKLMVKVFNYIKYILICIVFYFLY